jgi:hypothetical protein
MIMRVTELAVVVVAVKVASAGAGSQRAYHQLLEAVS